MELTLDQNDIKEALTNYVSKMGVDISNKRVDIALINGRMGNGNRAIVSITGQEDILQEIVQEYAPLVVSKSVDASETLMEEVVEDIPLVQLDFEDPIPASPTSSLF